MSTHTHFTYRSLKAKKMIQQGILDKVTHWGSSWASPIVAIKKIDGDIKICSDYKIGINHHTCSDLFPLPSIETASHRLTNMKRSAKINLKLAYNQIEIDNKFNETTTLNTPMGLLRWSCLPFRIKTARHIFQRGIEKILFIKTIYVWQPAQERN